MSPIELSTDSVWTAKNLNVDDLVNLNCRPRGGNVQIISVTGPGGEVGFSFDIFSEISS